MHLYACVRKKKSELTDKICKILTKVLDTSMCSKWNNYNYYYNYSINMNLASIICRIFSQWSFMNVNKIQSLHFDFNFENILIQSLTVYKVIWVINIRIVDQRRGSDDFLSGQSIKGNLTN